VPLIASMQKSLYARLLPEADPKLQEEIRLLRLDAEKRGFDTDQRVLADNGILGTLLERSAEKLQARYDWRYRLVRSQAWQRIAITLHPDVLEWLRTHGLDEGLPGKSDGEAYVAQCRSESVPTPPEFPSPHWGMPRTLEPEFNLVASPGDVMVYAWQNADGVCYALPRVGAMQLGIICQSRRTGKACFYDNLRPTSRLRIDWTRETIVPAEVQNGNDLTEECTECHRGGNAFIIHPGSALQIPGINTHPEVRYTPIGGRDFVNPGPLSLPALTEPATQASCDGCHEIPHTSAGYCGVLGKALRTTMPPDETPVGWDVPSTHAYYLHMAFLSDRCTFSEF
jgi:hypothetical protein